MIALINPGPRHPATRAAMNVGVGKTNPLHILPIAASVLGGDYMGGGEIEPAMRFFRKQQNSNVENLLSDMLATLPEKNPENIAQSFPGFGTRNGGIEIMATEIANHLVNLDAAGKALHWVCDLNAMLQPKGVGILMTGVAAAVFADLGFQPRTGGSLFQLMGAPGLLAHGLELANKSITAMPFVSDEHYEIQR